MRNLPERLKRAADAFDEQPHEALALLLEVMDVSFSSKHAVHIEQVSDSKILAKLSRADAMAIFEMALPAVRAIAYRSPDEAKALIDRLADSMGGVTVEDLSRQLPEVVDAETARHLMELGANPNFAYETDVETGAVTTALGKSMQNRLKSAYTEMICLMARADQIPLFQYVGEDPQPGAPGTVTVFDRLISYTAADWTAETEVLERLAAMDLSHEWRRAIGSAVMEYNNLMHPGTMGEQCLGDAPRKIVLLNFLSMAEMGATQAWLDVIEPANNESPNLAWVSCVGMDGKSRDAGRRMLRNTVEDGLDPNVVRAVFKGGRTAGSWLSAAVYNHNLDMVAPLLEAGVDPGKTITLTDGTMNAIELARARDFVEGAQLIEAWAAKSAIAGVLEKARAARLNP